MKRSSGTFFMSVNEKKNLNVPFIILPSFLIFVEVCGSAKLSAAPGLEVVWRVSWVEAAPVGWKIHYLCLYWPPLPRFCPLLPHRTQESLWSLHPQALHKVYLPHCIVPDFSVPAAACIPAHCHHRTRQAGSTGPSTDHCGVDDITMGAGWVWQGWEWFVQGIRTMILKVGCWSITLQKYY